MSVFVTGQVVGLDAVKGRDGKNGYRILQLMSTRETETGSRASFLTVMDFEQTSVIKMGAEIKAPVSVGATAGKNGAAYVNMSLSGPVETVESADNSAKKSQLK